MSDFNSDFDSISSSGSGSGSNLLQIALSALATASQEDAEQKLTSIVALLESQYGENQKEVAAELQRLAREIESSGKFDQAIEFKQRTTEIMLRVSMERRRAMREAAGAANGSSQASPPYIAVPPHTTQAPPHTQAPAQNQPLREPTSTKYTPSNNPARSTRANLGALSSSSAEALLGKSGVDLFHSVQYVVQSNIRFETELHFYTDILRAKIFWQSDEVHRRAAAIRLAHGPELILVESQIPSPSLNVYYVTTLGAARERLESYGFLKRGELKTPLGQALIFCGPDGNTLAILPMSGR